LHDLLCEGAPRHDNERQGEKKADEDRWGHRV
jgi:hypothetical protein